MSSCSLLSPEHLTSLSDFFFLREPSSSAGSLGHVTEPFLPLSRTGGGLSGRGDGAGSRAGRGGAARCRGQLGACARARLCTRHVCAHVCVCAYVRMLTRLRVYMCACMHVCACTRECVLCACVLYVCVHACVRACACVWERGQAAGRWGRASAWPHRPLRNVPARLGSARRDTRDTATSGARRCACCKVFSRPTPRGGVSVLIAPWEAALRRPARPREE